MNFEKLQIFLRSHNFAKSQKFLKHANQVMKFLKSFKFDHKPDGEMIKCLFANCYGYEILTYFKIFNETNTFQSFTTFS